MKFLYFRDYQFSKITDRKIKFLKIFTSFYIIEGKVVFSLGYTFLVLLLKIYNYFMLIRNTGSGEFIQKQQFLL